MRTYLLALTKYGIAALAAAYTLLAFVLLFKKGKTTVKQLCNLQLVLMIAFTVISYATLYTALDNSRYLFLCLLQVVAFSGINLLYQMLYDNAYMPLFNNMCMLLSAGLIILSRLGLDRAVRQFIIACAGLIFATVFPLLRSQFYLLKKPKYLYAFGGIVILAIVMLLGSTTLGANITYTIFGLTFQPSEFVKILYILFLASTLKDIRDLKDLLVVGIFSAAHVLVLIGSRDLGSGLIYYVVFLFMVYMATGMWIFLAAGFGAGALGAVLCYHMFSHIQVRMQAFKDPWSVIDGIGYQVTQSLFAIGAGGPFGVGLGQGIPEKIPFVESDFIFAAVAEEFGMIVGICIILILLNCFLHMLSLSMHFADKFYRLLAYGSAISLCFQAFLTLGGQTKFIPLTGVTTPLISYGGSSILATLILFTFVEVMYILRGDKIDEYKAKQRRQQQPRRRTRQTRAYSRDY